MESLRQQFLILISGLTVTLCVAQAKPNIVFIMADDMGYECLGINGADDYATPNLDTLAAAGMRFTNAYASPLCTPTRVKVMTGQYNVRNYEKFGVLPRGETTFAHILKNSGYRTAIVGKWQLGSEADSAQHFGFEESFLWQQSGRRTKRGTTFDSRHSNPIFDINGVTVEYNNGEFGPDLCVDFINDFIETNQDEPFLVYFPMLLPHCPFVPVPGIEDWDPTSPGSSTYVGDPAYFGDMVSYIDILVKRIVDKLESLDLMDNTILIFTGDNGTDSPVVTSFNGENIRGGKGKMDDSGTLVPLIVYGPSTVAAGVVTDEIVDFADFLPTFCDIAETLLPEDHPRDGVSLWGTFQGLPGRDKPYAYIWYSPHGETEKAMVYARNKTRMLRRRGSEAELEYFDSARPFTLTSIDISNLDSEETARFEGLLEVITKHDKIR
jgi:arylsulfatase A